MSEINKPEASFFGIQDSLEIGTGDTSLLNSLFAEEIGDVSELEKIDSPPSPKQSTKKAEPSISKEDISKEDEDKKAPLTGESLINSLFDETDEEEEEEENSTATQNVDNLEEEDKKEDISIFSTFSKDLFKIGAFTKEEGEEDIAISTPEEFLERFNVEKQKGAKQIVDDFLSGFGEDYKQAFEAIYVKGVNPKQYFSSYNEIVDYSNMDMTKEENQIKVVTRMLADQDFEQEDIDSEIEKLKNYGDLESTSAKYHKAILKKDVQKLKNIEQENERQLNEKRQIKQQYTQAVQSTIEEKVKTKEFDGIPLSANMAKKLNEFLLVEKYKDKNGNLLTDFDLAMLQLKNPENHQLKVKVGLLLKTLEEDPTLSTIKKTGITKQTDTLFSEVARMGRKSTQGKTNTNSSNLSSNIFSKNL